MSFINSSHKMSRKFPSNCGNSNKKDTSSFHKFPYTKRIGYKYFFKQSKVKNPLKTSTRSHTDVLTTISFLIQTRSKIKRVPGTHVSCK